MPKEARVKSAASLVVSPSTVTAGKGVDSLQGSGFETYEKVAIVLVKADKGQDLLLAEVTANVSGAFYVEGSGKIGKAMEAISPGVHTVKATGTAGSLATAPLRVTEPRKP